MRRSKEPWAVRPPLPLRPAFRYSRVRKSPGTPPAARLCAPRFLGRPTPNDYCSPPRAQGPQLGFEMAAVRDAAAGLTSAKASPRLAEDFARLPPGGGAGPARNALAVRPSAFPTGDGFTTVGPGAGAGTGTGAARVTAGAGAGLGVFSTTVGAGAVRAREPESVLARAARFPSPSPRAQSQLRFPRSLWEWALPE